MNLNNALEQLQRLKTFICYRNFLNTLTDYDFQQCFKILYTDLIRARKSLRAAINLLEKSADETFESCIQKDIARLKIMRDSISFYILEYICMWMRFSVADVGYIRRSGFTRKILSAEYKKRVRRGTRHPLEYISEDLYSSSYADWWNGFMYAGVDCEPLLKCVALACVAQY